MNILEMTKQQIFDVVVQGLASQGWMHSLDGTHCKYRGAKGTKCAAGHLIDDYMYSYELEQKAADSYDLAAVLGYTKEDYDHPSNRDQLRFVRDLQQVHDNSAAPYLNCDSNYRYTPEEAAEIMRQRYMDYANSYDLRFNEEKAA